MSIDKRIGRLIISAEGIQQKPVLFFFGRPFRLTWSQLAGWSSAEQVRQSANGTVLVVTRCIELHTEVGIKWIFFAPNDQNFHLVVKELRGLVPQLERASYLEALKNFRRE